MNKPSLMDVCQSMQKLEGDPELQGTPKVIIIGSSPTDASG